jgi:hypothetical protein
MGAYEEIMELKGHLVKADKDGDLERVRDVLKALASFDKMTEAIVKKSKAGKTLKDMKANYDKKGHKDVSSIIVDILKAWTKIAKQEGAGGGKKKEAATAVVLEEKAAAPVEPQPAGEVAPHRLKIMDVMANAMKGKAMGKNTSVDCNSIARAIEFLINAKNPYDEDNFKNNVEYNAKIRSLVFNMKKNGELTNAVIAGRIAPAELIVMTPNELADEALAAKRKELADTDTAARRTDWIDVHKKDILANCGVVEDENIQKLEDEEQEVSDDDG